MSHITESELSQRLNKANQQIEIGARYRHSKTGAIITVLDIALLEASEQPAVIYRHEEGAKLVWVRAVDVFMSLDEIDGQKIPKFIKIEEKTNEIT
jgi:hypothetical protein